MMQLAGAVIAVLGFVILIKRFGVIGRSLRTIHLAKSSVSIIHDIHLNDRQKELALQKHAKELFVNFFSITAGSIAALGISLGLVWLLQQAHLLTLHEVLETTLSWKFITAAVLVSAGWILFVNRKHANTSVAPYSFTERMMHHLAFISRTSGISLANMETSVYKKSIAGIEISKPVFITALPRTGTTLLLELCTSNGGLVSHTYSDMPFFFTPLFWNRFAGRFRHSGPCRERAHGDGMMISAHSPEAFEEIFWKAFWPSRYRRNRIVPWAEPAYPDFEIFFRDHIRKIIFLRRGDRSSPPRYISKNNLNIARIQYIKHIFPDAVIIVPFRNPLQHASSLLKQHLRFLKIHSRDAFARKYMEDIGHYDFGRNLRPVDFDGWYSSDPSLNPATMAFWLKYWLSAYGYLLRNCRDNIALISFDSLCGNAAGTLKRLAKHLDLENIDGFLKETARIKLPVPHPVNMDEIPADLPEKADALFSNLQKASLF